MISYLPYIQINNEWQRYLIGKIGERESKKRGDYLEPWFVMMMTLLTCLKRAGSLGGWGVICKHKPSFVKKPRPKLNLSETFKITARLLAFNYSTSLLIERIIKVKIRIRCIYKCNLSNISISHSGFNR